MMKARISQLYKTEKEWNALSTFIPIKGELVVFGPDENHNYARLKIGDGNTTLKELPFIVDKVIDEFKETYDKEIIDGGRITDYKK